MRARSLAMPSSVMRPCSVSAMGPPWAGPRARPEQPDDRLFEEAALDGERARREKVVAPAGQPAERRGVGEVREDHAEEGDAQVRDLLRLPAGVARRLAHHRDALAVERADPALEERLHRDRKSTRLNSSHLVISYAVFCLKKKKKTYLTHDNNFTTRTHTSMWCIRTAFSTQIRAVLEPISYIITHNHKLILPNHTSAMITPSN